MQLHNIPLCTCYDSKVWNRSNCDQFTTSWLIISIKENNCTWKIKIVFKMTDSVVVVVEIVLLDHKFEVVDVSLLKHLYSTRISYMCSRDSPFNIEFYLLRRSRGWFSRWIRSFIVLRLLWIFIGTVCCFCWYCITFILTLYLCWSWWFFIYCFSIRSCFRLFWTRLLLLFWFCVLMFTILWRFIISIIICTRAFLLYEIDINTYKL